MQRDARGRRVFLHEHTVDKVQTRLRKMADQQFLPVLKSKGLKPRFPPKAPGFEGSTSPKRCECQFPLWGDHEKYVHGASLYCGAPRGLESPYCGFHAERVKGNGTKSERTAHKVLEKAAV